MFPALFVFTGALGAKVGDTFVRYFGETNTFQMEPFVRAVLIVTAHHLAIGDLSSHQSFRASNKKKEETYPMTDAVTLLVRRRKLICDLQ